MFNSIKNLFDSLKIPFDYEDLKKGFYTEAQNHYNSIMKIDFESPQFISKIDKLYENSLKSINLY